MALPPRVTARWAWRRTMSWCHCQFSSSTSSSDLYWAMPTMSTIPSRPPRSLWAASNMAVAPVPIGGVAGPADAVDLLGDVVGPVLLDVHAEDLGPLLGEGVGGLAADALPGPDDHEALAVQAEAVGEVGTGESSARVMAQIMARHCGRGPNRRAGPRLDGAARPGEGGGDGRLHEGPVRLPRRGAPSGGQPSERRSATGRRPDRGRAAGLRQGLLGEGRAGVPVRRL